MSDAVRGPRPRVFRLEPDAGAAPAGETGRQRLPAYGAVVEPQADPYADPSAQDALRQLAAVAPAADAARRRGGLSFLRLSWSGLLWSALGGLISLSLGLWVSRLVGELFSAAMPLGWLGAALAALALLALTVLAAREILALARLRHIARLSAALAAAYASDDTAGARSGLAELLALYDQRPGMARRCAALRQHMGAIIDGRDLIGLAERDLLAPLDAAARQEIALAARRVSAVTAISPRAIVDLAFVLAQAVRLLRRVAAIYGGRPGLLGFFRLARSIGAHLAVTGGMAAGDSLVQQLVGHGIAAKLSARLGEGVLNGLLTTRVGLAAMAVCRPLPFSSVKAPGVRDVAPFLFGGKDATL